MAGNINLKSDTLDIRVVAESATLGAGVVGTFSPHPLQFYTDSTVAMTVDPGGCVGFQTTPVPGWNSVATGQSSGHLVQLNSGGFMSASSRSDLTSMCGVRNTDGQGTIALHSVDGDKLIINQTQCDIQVPLYVQGVPKSVQNTFLDLEKDGKLKDTLIEKLTARLEALERKAN